MREIAEELEKHEALLADFTKGEFLEPPVLIHRPSDGFAESELRSRSQPCWWVDLDRGRRLR
jgi:hypothetical protein